MSLKWPSSKDPDDILDYDVDWSKRITGEDIITSSTFTVVSGTVEIGDTFIDAATHKTTVWLSGGEDGEIVSILNRIVTAAGRQMDQTVQLKIRVR